MKKLMNINRLARLFLVFGVFVCNVGVAAERIEARANSEYTLGSGDIIRIQVYDEPDLSFEFQLDDSGSISYPFLGELSFVGLSSGQLENSIVRGLKGDYLVDPKVTITILQYRNFYINGEVSHPGGLPFQPGLTIRKAVSLAGGFTERASKRNIFVISDDDPKHSPKRVGLDATVKPGDIITIEQSFF